MDVDAVEQRSADLGEIALNLAGRADAVVGGVAIIAAGAGVHGGDEHKTAGVVDGVLGTADGDVAVFKRLAEHFEGALIKLRKFVEEQNPVMSQRDFSWLWIGASAHECHL